VLEHIERIGDALPFPLHGLTYVNHNAFMYATVFDFCEATDIELRRSPAYNTISRGSRRMAQSYVAFEAATEFDTRKRTPSDREVSEMSKRHTPHAAEFRAHMMELVKAGRTPE
jgi:hypothetical protein